MEIRLKPEQEIFVQQSIARGRFLTADQVMDTAIALLQEREGHDRPAPSSERKSLVRLFAESPLKGLEIDFPREKELLRSVEL